MTNDKLDYMHFMHHLYITGWKLVGLRYVRILYSYGVRFRAGILIREQEVGGSNPPVRLMVYSFFSGFKNSLSLCCLVLLAEFFVRVPNKYITTGFSTGWAGLIMLGERFAGFVCVFGAFNPNWSRFHSSLNAFSGALLIGEEQIVFYGILVYTSSRGFPDAGASFSLVCSALIHRMAIPGKKTAIWEATLFTSTPAGSNQQQTILSANDEHPCFSQFLQNELYHLFLK